MNYPIVFPSNQRSFSGMGLAVLSNAQNVKIKQVVNGEYTLSLVLPRNDDAWEFLSEENFIYVDGQAFRIRSFDEMRDSVGKLVSNINCEHVCYDLNDVRHLPNMRDIINVTPMKVFWDGFYDDNGTEYDGVLKNTSFTFFSPDLGSTDLFLSKCTPRAVLNEFISKLDCDVVFDNFNISLVSRVGNANSGATFHIGKNITNIKRTTDSSGLCTRLYPYGKEYLDITSVNAGKAYIDSPLINNFDYPHEDYRDYNDIDNPADLKNKALLEWSTQEKDGIDKPKITYEVGIVELKKIPEFADFQKFSIGDTVTVIDDELGINVNARVMEYEFYPFEPKRSTVVLANFKNNIGGMFADIVKNQNIIKDITNNKGEIRDSFVESVHDTLSVKFNQSLTKKTVVYDYANMWVDDMQNPTSAIALVDGMFAMANAKNSDGTWNWRTIGNSSGLVADSVISNWVYAGKVSASQIDAGTINTDLITMKSSDGRLKISSNSIEMKANDGSYLKLSPTEGFRLVHKYDTNGRAVEETKLTKFGLYKFYSEFDANGADTCALWSNYVETITTQTCGGSGFGELFTIELDSPPWRDINKNVYAFVTPNETLRFIDANGGRIGDLKDYVCKIQNIEQNASGVYIDVLSKKTYVSAISNNQPVFSSGSMQFNILVICK